MIFTFNEIFWIFGFICFAFSSEWTYTGDHGPGHWKDMEGNEACGRQRQSPIDIDTSQAVVNENLGTISFTGYDTKPTSMTMLNNGHTAQVDIEGDVKISGGGLDGEYKTAQFHFHWGSMNSKGSEHFIHGKQYPMEMHLVHYSSQYSTLDEAVSQPNALAALSFMIQVTEGNNTALNGLLSGLKNISHKDTTHQIESFSLDKILPKNRNHFYRYKGSITTPPCHETVTWTIFSSKIHMSQSQLDEFRQLHSNEEGDTEHEGEIYDNFRSLQELNGRTIYTNSSDNSNPPHLLIFILLSLLSLYV